VTAISEDLPPGLSRFFAQAARLPLLTHVEEVALSKRVQGGDATAKRRLVEHNIRLAINLAKQYRNQGVDFEDLIMDACVGLHRAAEKYDWSKGFRFSTYATWWVRHHLQRAVQKHGDTIRIPANTRARRSKIFHHLLEHPDATTAELAKIADCREDQVKEALDGPRVVTSLDQTVRDGETPLHALIADPDGTRPDEIVVRDERLKDALTKLGDFERRVITLRFGFDGPVLSRDDVADTLGVAPHVVQRAQKSALVKLAHELGDTIGILGGGVSRSSSSSSLRSGGHTGAAPTCRRAAPCF
jgi:RNA polymerase primary sigma factor